MSHSPEPDRISIQNEESINTLARAITYSQGEFSLILVRCNYAFLRERIMQKLRQQCTVEIQELEILPASETLYTALSNAIGQEHPQALAVFGLEMVKALDAVLSSTNQVREEFRKSFAFPVVLWINNDILRRLIQQVPDLESWASIIEFEISPNELSDFLQTTADQVFNEFLEVGAAPFLNKLSRELSNDYRLGMELLLAQNDIQSQQIDLESDLSANLEFLIGLSRAGSMQASKQHYEQSLALCPPDYQPERRGCICYQLAMWWRTRAVQHRSEYTASCQKATEYFQQVIAIFEESNRPDLVAKFINPAGEAIQRLQRWSDLEPLARKSLSLNETFANLYRQSEASGLLAEALLGRSVWQEAKQEAERALQLLDSAIENESECSLKERLDYINWQKSFSRGWYLFALGRAQWQLGQHQDAIYTLEIAREKTYPEYDPPLFIQILRTLRNFYFDQKEYLKAFDIRLEYHSLEQQYGFRAFVGAGRLKPQREVLNPALVTIQLKQKDQVSQEIAASGRQESVNRLIERIGRADQKLIVLHGQSGVGKSSIIQAGLIPSLDPITLDTREVMTILQQVYTNWTEHLGREMLRALQKVGLSSLPKSFASPPIILDQLRKSVDRNLMIVLIFDQFEEFFFVHKEPNDRKPFYEFLKECLDIPYVKVILSLREDYLHFLLECNDRLVDLEVINNNILDKRILFYLGNFSKEEAKSVFQALTKDTPYPLNPKLIKEVVKDLSEDLGEIRPVELQIIGTQLQAEQITTLEQYREKGPKDALVSRFLDEVTHACGPENEDIARLVLYLLTDENNTRPLKTREDIELEINVSDKLDLILTILVKSGLVFKIPSSPSDRYQLVHDYLVIFVRQGQSTKLIAELEKEREQRQLTEKQLNEALQKQLRTARRATFTLVGLVTAVTGVALLAILAFINTSIAGQTSASAQEGGLQRMTSALRVGKFRKRLPGILPEFHLSLLAELSQAVNTTNLIGEMKGHTNEVTDIALSQNGNLIASSSKDKTAIVWNINGIQKATFEHSTEVNCVDLSPDGTRVVTGDADGFVRLWTSTGTLIKKLEENHDGGVLSISYSPDGKRIVSGGKDSRIRIWDNSGSLMKTLEDHESEVLGIRFSSSGNMMATFAKFDPVMVWNSISLEKINSLDNYSALDIDFKEESNSIEVAGVSAQILNYNLLGNNEVMGGSFVPSYHFPQYLKSVKSVKHGNWYAFVDAYRENIITVGQSLGEGDYRQPIELSHKENVTAYDIDGKNGTIISADKTNKLYIWDIREATENSDESILENKEALDKLLRLSPKFKSYVLVTDNETAFTKNHPNSLLSKLLTSNGSILSFSSDDSFFVSAARKIEIKSWKLTDSATQVDGILNLNSSISKNGILAKFDFFSKKNLLAIGSEDGFLELRTTTGTELFKEKAHAHEIDIVVFSPDGQKVVSADKELIKIWSIRGELVNKIPLLDKEDNWKEINFSPNSQTFISLTQKGKANLWLTEGAVKASLAGHATPIHKAFFSSDGERIITLSRDAFFADEAKYEVKIWNSNGSLVNVVEDLSGGVSVDLSPDGEEIYFYGYGDNSVARLSINGEILNPLKGHVGPVKAVKYSSNKEFIATASEDSTIRIWNKKGDLIRIFRGHDAPISNFDVSLDLQTMVSIDNEGIIKIWKFNDSNAVNTIPQYASEYDEKYDNFIFFSDDGKNIILQGGNLIRILSLSGEKVIEPQFGEFINLEALSTSSKLDTLVSVSQTDMLELQNSNGDLLESLGAHSAQINAASISPDGQRIASAGKDKVVKLWDRSGNLLKSIRHEEPVNSVSFSVDGNFLVTASDDELIQVFDRNGEPILDEKESPLRLAGHTDSVTSVLFSPNGQNLASASIDGTIRLWNIQTWEQEGKEIEIPGDLDNSAIDVLWFGEHGNLLAYGTDPVYVRLLNNRFRGGTWIKEARFHPLREIPEDGLQNDNKWITVKGNRGVIVLSLGLDHSLKQACKRVADHLQANDIKNDDKLCHGILN